MSDKMDYVEEMDYRTTKTKEFLLGDISGKEFVEAMRRVESELSARINYDSLKTIDRPRIYDLRCGDHVSVPVNGYWRKAKIHSFYATDVGIIAEFHNGFCAPFSLYECRVWKPEASK